jgi:hypothetical protein
MMPELAAHVLRLDHAPVAAALARGAKLVIVASRSHGKTLLGPQFAAFVDGGSVLAVRIGSATRETCRVCDGSRVCPDCGEPCEVCTVAGGSRYPVFP